MPDPFTDRDCKIRTDIETFQAPHATVRTRDDGRFVVTRVETVGGCKDAHMAHLPAITVFLADHRVCLHRVLTDVARQASLRLGDGDTATLLATVEAEHEELGVPVYNPSSRQCPPFKI